MLTNIIALILPPSPWRMIGKPLRKTPLLKFYFLLRLRLAFFDQSSDYFRSQLWSANFTPSLTLSNLKREWHVIALPPIRASDCASRQSLLPWLPQSSTRLEKLAKRSLQRALSKLHKICASTSAVLTLACSTHRPLMTIAVISIVL